jgi:SAM-dependent methyltransferase
VTSAPTTLATSSRTSDGSSSGRVPRFMLSSLNPVLHPQGVTGWSGMDTARATSFGAWADEYDVWRPTYPDAAVDWLVPTEGAHVAEVGAGTGKLTDRLIERRLNLDVVEPDARMLGIIRQRHPGLRAHETGATRLPLGEASVDAVVVADAWHWFPKEEAAAEVARVLRPNGWLGCVWNVPLLQQEWQWQALRLDPALQLPGDLDPLDRLGLSTGDAEQRSFRWAWTLHRGSGEASSRRSRTSDYSPKPSARRHLMRPSNWSHGRAWQRGQRPRPSLTTLCACVGTHTDRGR